MADEKTERTLRVDLILTEQEYVHFERKGILAGFLRVDPRKKWKRSEKDECVRLGVVTALNEVFRR